MKNQNISISSTEKESIIKNTHIKEKQNPRPNELDQSVKD